MASYEQNKRAETLSIVTKVIISLLSDELKKITDEKLITTLKECDVFRKSKILHIFKFDGNTYIRIGSNFYEKVHFYHTFYSEKIEGLNINYKKNDIDLSTSLALLSGIYK